MRKPSNKTSRSTCILLLLFLVKLESSRRYYFCTAGQTQVFYYLPQTYFTEQALYEIYTPLSPTHGLTVSLHPSRTRRITSYSEVNYSAGAVVRVEVFYRRGVSGRSWAQTPLSTRALTLLDATLRARII